MKRNSVGGRYNEERAARLAGVRRQRGAYKLKGELLQSVEASLARKNSPIPPTSVTFDNGTEFADHLKIAQQINAPIYFAHPYHS